MWNRRLLTVFPGGGPTTVGVLGGHPERGRPVLISPSRPYFPGHLSRYRGLLSRPLIYDGLIVSLSPALTAPPKVAKGLVLAKSAGGVSVTTFDKVPEAEGLTVATTV